MRLRAALGVLLASLTMALADPGEARATAGAQSIAVPSYIYPDHGRPGSFWDRLGEDPLPGSTVVVNPASGPGTAPDPAYAEGVRRSRAAGLTVLGYVPTGYGADPLNRGARTLEDEIDRYYSWYGVDGIFLDEASTEAGPGPDSCADAGPFALYERLYGHIKERGGPAAVVALNPGTQTDECYMRVSDVVVTFEGSHAAYHGESAPARNYVPNPPWVEKYAPERFWHLVYDAPTEEEMRRSVHASKERSAGRVYVTPDVMDNPWDTLPPPPYWAALKAAAGSPDAVANPVADTLGPVADPPAASLIPLAQLDLSATPVPVRLSLSATDAEGAVERYELEYALDGGPFTAVELPQPATASVVLNLRPGDHVFRLRGIDAAGNRGEWARSELRLGARQENGAGVSYPSGSWTTAFVASAYGGALRYAGASPARARFAFTGSQVAWVGTQGPNRGRAEVWVDGVQVDGDPGAPGTQPFDLYAETLRPREVVFHRDFGMSGAHTLEVRALGNRGGGRVDVDAFLFVG